MGNNPNNYSFDITIKYEDNNRKDETDEIIVKKADTIKEVRHKILEKIEYIIEEKYILIYKDDQLLDENKTVSDYDISPADVLIYKSSRKDEFSVFFCRDNDKYEKLVTKEEIIYDAFNPLNKYLNSDFKSKYGYKLDLIYQGIILEYGKTFADYNIKQNDKIVVNVDEKCG